jgi:hypothetical protein
MIAAKFAGIGIVGATSGLGAPVLPLPGLPLPVLPLPGLPGLGTITMLLVVIVMPLLLVELDAAWVQPGQSMPKSVPAVTVSNRRSLSLLAAEALPAINDKTATPIRTFFITEPPCGA